MLEGSALAVIWKRLSAIDSYGYLEAIGGTECRRMRLVQTSYRSLGFRFQRGGLGWTPRIGPRCWP